MAANTVIWKHPDWTPSEVPKAPGSPASLEHSVPIRVRFGLIALLCGATGTLGNALLSSNLPQIQGHLGLTPVQGQWLLAAYVMANCWANLVVFKFRIQFGIRAFAFMGLGAYALLCVLQIFVHSYDAALLARAASGFAAAPLSTLTTLYFIQCAGPKNVAKGVVAGISLVQVVTPLAFILSPALNNLGEAGLQYMFEAGLALSTLAAIAVFPLPYNAREKIFEWQDLVSVALFAPGLALLVAAISQGRTQWWTDTPWIGTALALSLVLVIAGLAWEHSRRTPLLFTRWLSAPDILFFIVAGLFIRFLTSEQTVGAVGFLRTLGMSPEQLVPLYRWIAASAVAGMLAALILTTAKTVPWLLMTAVALILVGCLLDRDATPQDAPRNFYLSQSIVSFASALFVGPLLLLGLGKVLTQGPRYIVSMVVVFSFTQSLGLLLGNAVLSSYQLFREHVASGAINEGVDPTNPVVHQRIAQLTAGLDGVVGDPALRSASGMSELAQSATANANTIAYNDVFSLLAVMAAVFLIVTSAWMAIRARKATKP